MNYTSKKRLQLGHVAQKVLLLLIGGAALSLTSRPDAYFRIVKYMVREWKKINQRSLREAIRRLYRSKLVTYRENADGTIALVLTESGRKKALRYNLDTIQIKKQSKWDGIWRMVLFDIPETKKNGRDALTAKLKYLGFHPLQKSVFIYPYECKDEIDFIVEIFDLAPPCKVFKNEGC